MTDSKKTKKELADELAEATTRLEKSEASLKRARKSEKDLRDENKQLSLELEQIKKTQKRTIQQERLHALGRMASGIVHDFNNTLTPILGASDFLISNPDMLDSRADTLTLLESMRTAARDGRVMVKRLRSFYKPEEDEEVSAVDVNRVVDQVVLLTQSKWGHLQARGVTVTMKTDLEPVPSVVMNESHLRSVLTNLVLNAVDAMEDKGGEITITTRHEDEWVVIEVQDTGKGMPDDILEHCFEPFFSTKGRDGTGMGLAMVYGVIRNYEGEIDVESELGKGTTIRVAFGASDEEPGRLEVVSGPHPVRLLKVLIVDDNPPSRDVMTACLASDGHAVDTASGAKEALKKCGADKYDVILLDVVMPGASGLDIVSEIKRMLPKTHVVLVTGSVDCVDSNNLPEGIDIVLGKPVTQAELRQAIAKVMTGKLKKPRKKRGSK